MSEMGFGPWNIIDLIRGLGLCLVVPVFLRFRSWDVRNVHGISDEFRRRDGSRLNLGKVINGRQWVMAKTVSRELHAFGRGALDISYVQVSLGFVEANM